MPPSNIQIQWSFNSGALDGTIDFLMSWPWNSWMGLGFNTAMTQTDMVIMNLDNDQIELLSCFSKGQNVSGSRSLREREKIRQVNEKAT